MLKNVLEGLVGEMIRIMTAAFLASVISLPAAARAQDPELLSGTARMRQAATIQLAQADAPAPRRRFSNRLHIYPNRDYWPDDVYPRYDPGPNAVRVCNATYVQEFRPSGTVIVPRVSCVWRGR